MAEVKNTIRIGEEKASKIDQFVSQIFKKYDKPYHLKGRQADIVWGLLNPDIKWLWITAPTRFGKSEVTALAVLVLAALMRLKVKIVGATKEKANKIMEYVIEHVADNPLLYATLINKDVVDVEKLKVIARKTELRWSDGGWVSIVSAGEMNRRRHGETLVGEGADVVIVEEAGLMRDPVVFNKIVRMREPDRGWGKLVLIGNLIEGGIFERAYNDDKFEKIFITLEEAKQAKGWTDEFLEEQKSQMTTKDWKRYYSMEWVRADEWVYFKPQKYNVLPPLERLSLFGGLDPALGEAKNGSMTAIVILGKDKFDGQVYEVESIVEKLNPNDTIKEVIRLANVYNFKRFFVEEVQYQKFLKDTMKAEAMRQGVHLPVVGVKQTAKKTERIESLEPAINTGLILFKGGNRLWEELRDYPDCEYLDGLDALELTFRNLRKKDWFVV